MMTPDELAARYFLARILWWRHDLEKLDAAAVNALLKSLARANVNIRDKIERELPALLPDIHKGAALHMWLNEITAPMESQVVDTITDAWTVSAAESLNAYNDILSFDGKAQNIMPVPATPESVKALASTSPFSGKSLAALVSAVFHDGIAAEMVQCVNTCMNKGWGHKKIVDALLRESIDKGFVVTRNQCITLSRSYIQQASVNAQMAVYRKNSDVVKGVKWTAILDNRVCGKCAALDGQTYGWNEPRPKMIAHPRCRCLWLPWLKSYRDLGIDMDDLEEAARPWILREKGNIDAGGNRKILEAGTTKENFGGWWKTLPYEEQVKSIGTIRTGLVNSGKLKFDDLVDKSTGKYFTLEELNFRRDGSSMSGKRFFDIEISELEQMPHEQAGKAIREVLRNKYPSWSENNQLGNLPVAVIPENDAAIIGSKARVAVFSPDTLLKQKDHHPELTVEDYIKAQDAVERGEKFKQGDKKLAFALDETDGVIAIFKRSNDGDVLFFTSLWKLSDKPRERAKTILKLSKKK